MTGIEKIGAVEVAAGTAEEADVGIAAQVGRRAQDGRQVRAAIQKSAREKRNSGPGERGTTPVP